MRHIVLCSVLLVAISLAGGCACQGEKPEQMIAAAKALDNQAVNAINSRNVDALMATSWNSPDYVSYPVGSMEARGWEAVKADAAKMLASLPRGATIEATDSNYMVAGDAVISWGTWRVKTPQEKGQPVVLDGRTMGVVAKRDGKWVYILDQSSVPWTPPSESPAKR
jgi:ketosteroid isomerase-like protein